LAPAAAKGASTPDVLILVAQRVDTPPPFPAPILPGSWIYTGPSVYRSAGRPNW